MRFVSRCVSVIIYNAGSTREPARSYNAELLFSLRRARVRWLAAGAVARLHFSRSRAAFAIHVIYFVQQRISLDYVNVAH